MAFNQGKHFITQSILNYRQLLFNDINLSLRVTDKNEVSHVTRILRWDDDHITFYAPLAKRDWVIFYIGDILDICFLSKSGMYMSTMQLNHKFTQENNLYYSATLLSPLEKKQQREHFRLDILLPIHFKLVSSPAFSLEEIDKKLPLKGMTVNISAGGMCVVCDDVLVKDTVLSLDLEFLGQPLTLLGEVLGNGHRNENGTYIHRIRFSDVDAHTERLLSKLIFEKQRLQRAGGNPNPLYKK